MKITVTVEGPTGSGKTALCQLISDTLNSYAIHNKVPEVLDERTNRSEYRTHPALMVVLTQIARNCEVEIIEKNER